MTTWPEVSSCRGFIWPKCQPDPKSYHGDPSHQMSTWPKVSSDQNANLTWSLTKCQPDPKSYLGSFHLTKMPTWHKVWPNINLTWSLILGVNLTKMTTWPEICPNVKVMWSLTKCQHDPTFHLRWGPSDQMSTWPKVSSWGVKLTNCQPDLKSHLGRSICQSAERSSDFLSTLWGLHLLHIDLSDERPTRKLSELNS